MNLSNLQKTVKDREAGVLQPVGSQRVGHNLVTEQQQQEPKLSNTFSSRRDLITLATNFRDLPQFKDSLVHVLHSSCNHCLPGSSWTPHTPRERSHAWVERGSVCLSCGRSAWPVTVVLAGTRLCGGCPGKQADCSFRTLLWSALCKTATQFFIFKLGKLGPIYLFLVKEMKSIRKLLEPWWLWD